MFIQIADMVLVQVIVNRSRVKSRGLELNVPVKLTSLDKLPMITSEIKSMLHSHPKVSLEDQNPRCYVAQVGATSFNVAISCNLKPMVRHKVILTQTLRLSSAGDHTLCQCSSYFPHVHRVDVPQVIDDFLVAKEEVLLEASRIVVRSGAALGV